MHYATPRNGPTDLVLRACKFQKSSIQGHANDLARILKPQIEAGKSAVFLIVGNSPDWNLASLKTFIMYGRLWRDLHLDILCATSHSAGYSAFNDIKHLWVVVTKKLGAVTLSAVHGDDPKAPHYMAGISAKERSEKEVAVFDSVMSEVKQLLGWDDVQWLSIVYSDHSLQRGRGGMLQRHRAFGEFLEGPFEDPDQSGF